MPPPCNTYDIIILGAGAAGLFCAALAAERGRRVLLLDHAPRAGRKILISGGGRANFTNLNTRPEHFLSENPHFAKSALARYTPHDFVALVERYNIAYHAKAPGQLFCDGSAAQIVDMLLDLCAKARVRIELNTQIVALEPPAPGQTPTGTTHPAQTKSSDTPTHHYRVHTAPASGAAAPIPPTSTRTTYNAPSIIVATGGLSIPKLGATAFGHDLARHLGIRVVPPRPALVPLLFDPADRARFADLTGVATEVSVSVAPLKNGIPATFRDKLLITHRGVSGPAILQVSSYWRPGATLTLDLAPGQSVTAPLLTPGARRDLATAAAAWQAALPPPPRRAPPRHRPTRKLAHPGASGRRARPPPLAPHPRRHRGLRESGSHRRRRRHRGALRQNHGVPPPPRPLLHRRGRRRHRPPRRLQLPVGLGLRRRRSTCSRRRTSSMTLPSLLTERVQFHLFT